MKMPRIAVLLAAYNGARWINEQIESILNQENVDINIYISVDQSTDETEKIVEGIFNNNNRVFMLSSGKRYGSATTNFFRLIREVDFKKYDYVGFSDQDDIWLKNKYQQAIAFMKKTGSSGYSSNVKAVWRSGKQRIINKAQAQVRWDYLFEGGGPGCTYLLDRELAVVLQSYLTNNLDLDCRIDHHDWFYYAFARIKGFKWIIDNRVTVLYRQLGGNTEGANIGWKAMVARINEIITGDWIRQSLAIITINTEKYFPIKQNLGISKRDWLLLGMHCNQCRRKSADKILFF